MPKLSNVMRLALDQQRAALFADLFTVAARLAELDAQAAPMSRPHHTVKEPPCPN